MTDGTAVIGVVEREDEAEIVLRTASGVVMTIPCEQVRSITALEGERYFRIDTNSPLSTPCSTFDAPHPCRTVRWRTVVVTQAYTRPALAFSWDGLMRA